MICALDAWLDRVDTITCYCINCTLVIVLRYAGRNGWELFIPSSEKNNVEESLDNAAIALGVEGCCGLVAEGGAL